MASIFDSPMMSPESLFTLSGNIFAAPNLGAGLGAGLQQVGQNFATQKQNAEVKAVENKTRDFVAKAFPDVDAANLPPPVLRMYAEQAIKQRFQPKTSEFKELNDGTFGVWDGTSFNKLGTATKPVDPTTIQRDLQAAGLQPGTPEYQRAILEHYRKNGMTVDVAPDGSVRFVQGDINAPGKITEGQSKDINWITRGKGANDELAQLDAKLTSLSENTAAKLGTPGNYLKSENYQMAERAGREFLAVVLRKDSGGAITPDEYATYAPTFLPEPGDKPPVIERKRLARERFLDAMNAGLPDSLQKRVPDPSLSATPTDQTATQRKAITLPDGTQGTIRRTK